MGDPHNGHTRARLDNFDQLQDLLLDRYVQGRGWLVGDEQPGGNGQRDGYHHPLHHSSRKFVRESPANPLRVGEAHLA